MAATIAYQCLALMRVRTPESSPSVSVLVLTMFTSFVPTTCLSLESTAGTLLRSSSRKVKPRGKPRRKKEDCKERQRRLKGSVRKRRPLRLNERGRKLKPKRRD